MNDGSAGMALCGRLWCLARLYFGALACIGFGNRTSRRFVDVTVIVNPISGGGRGLIAAEGLCAALEARGAQATLMPTGRAGDAERFSRDAACDCVVGVGGDGTLNEIVNGIGEKAIRVGILPRGTANVVSRELKIPKKVELYADLVVSGQMRRMDAGLRDGRRFLLGAGAGLDAAVTKRVMSRRGKKSSYLRWIWPTIATVFQYRFPKMAVEVDGQRVMEDAQYAIVGNCVYSAGLFPATPKAKVNDGLLDVCLFRNLSYLRMLKLPIVVWRPSFIEHKDVYYGQSRQVSFMPAEGEAVPLQIDGDPAGEVPATFGIEPNAVEIIAPVSRG